jgi:rubrerythrin
MAPALSRREVLAASAALAGGAGAALLASCGADEPREDATETVSTTEVESDIAVLDTLLDLEESSVIAYETIGEQLGAPGFGSQERRHALVLRRMIGRLTGIPAPPKSAGEYRASFPEIAGARDALSFALDLETTSIGAYADALEVVVTQPVRVTLATILAAEAEHAAVMLGRLGRPQAPDAFVTGIPREPE